MASSPRLVFGVMSATQSAAVVDQLAQVLAPYPVWVHHDFTKRADFAPRMANIRLVPQPRTTGWGTWGLCEGVWHTLTHALKADEFDYFQLLSPTCLPIRPVAEFAAHIAQSPCQAHIDVIGLDADADALMTFAYRTFAAGNSWRFRVLRRLRHWYFGESSALVQRGSLAVLHAAVGSSGRGVRGRQRLALALTRAVAAGWAGTHPFVRAPAVIGGGFFGARRSVCEFLVAAARASDWDFFRRLVIADETLWATMLVHHGWLLGPANHVINAFDRAGHPRWIEAEDVPDLCASGRFFARKFIDDPWDATRLAVLRQIGSAPCSAEAHV